MIGLVAASGVPDPLDLGQVPADEGVRFLVEQFVAAPEVVVVPVVLGVLVPMVALFVGLRALVRVAGRPSTAQPPGDGGESW